MGAARKELSPEAERVQLFPRTTREDDNLQAAVNRVVIGGSSSVCKKREEGDISV